MCEQTINNSLRSAYDQLLAIGCDTATIDAQLLMAEVLAKPRSYLFAHGQNVLRKDQQIAFEALLARRLVHEPIAYILGYQEFWSMRLKVTPQVLIPRPDTEIVVEQALYLLPKSESRLVIDAGTGSGAIALAIAGERPECNVLASDFSYAALLLAKQNKAIHRIANCHLLQSFWLSAFAKSSADLIVSNPPYVEPDAVLAKDVLQEPATALFADDDGLADLKCIIEQALAVLKSSGWLLVEHGYQQAASVRQYFEQFAYNNISSVCDLSGHERATLGQKI